MSTSDFPREHRNGRFVRQQSAFRDRVTADGSSGFPAAPSRYRLYVSLACPWAHRTIIVRRLKGLDNVIGMTVVDPIRDARGWRFTTEEPDPAHGWAYLAQGYVLSDSGYDDRVTVPVLWDTQTDRIVSNESAEIIEMLNSEWDAWAEHPELDLWPEEVREEGDALNGLIYETVNDGVYRAGFSTTQGAYEDAVRPLFRTLDRLEARLADQRYLLGGEPTLSDWRLFTTLVRFDSVYHGHFKCNIRRIVDYPNLSAYLRDLYGTPGVAETVDLDQIKRHYYVTHTSINPTQIVPVGPDLDLAAPHDRAALAIAL
jgi:glutathionyl-hydroquinone reductase